MSLTGTHGEILEATIQLLRREESMSPASMYGDIIERTIEVLRQEQDMELTQTVGKILNFQNVTGRTKDRTAALETRTKLAEALANRRRAIGSPGDSD
jgi:predicted aconitase with swiveling domain